MARSTERPVLSPPRSLTIPAAIDRNSAGTEHGAKGWADLGAALAIARPPREGTPRVAEQLVVQPVFRVGKVPPLEEGTKQGDEILSQASQVRDDRDRLPAAAVVAKTQAVLASAERGTTRDGVAVVHEDVQMLAPGAHGYVSEVPEGLDGLLQHGCLLGRGGGRTAGLTRRHRGGGLSRGPEQGPWRGQLATDSR